MGALNTHPSSFHYCNDQGILQETGFKGEGDSKSSQSKIQCFGTQAHARNPGYEVPDTRYLV